LPGDSRALSIDSGLAQSRYGVVVLSLYFFSKEWPRRELGAPVALEISQGKVILPIWHRVTRDEVLRNPPMLVDKYALNPSVRSNEQLADELEEVLRNE
jgi:hypothetical protein